MGKLFIIIKRKGSKKLLGAIPARKGATVSKLRELIQKQKRAGFSAKIITENKLRMILKRILPKKARNILAKRRIKNKIRRKKRR